MSVAGDFEIGEELRERMGLGRGSCPTYPGAKPVESPALYCGAVAQTLLAIVEPEQTACDEAMLPSTLLPRVRRPQPRQCRLSAAAE
jgi:hypothetical protein